MPDFSALSDGNFISLDQLQKLAEQKCVKRPVPVNFFIAEEVMTFYRNRGEAGVNVQHAAKGDVVIVVQDEAWAVTPEYFAKHYDIIQTPADFYRTDEVPQTC